MKNLNGNKGRRSSRSLAAGLVLLLVLAGSPTAAAAQKSKGYWSSVQAEVPGTPITVVLYKDQAPRGQRRIKGRFHSATDDSVTLQPRYGPPRTLQRSAVRKLVAHRPRKIMRDWSRVQAVAPRTRTKVVLYKDQAPSWELRRIKGYFHSATDDSLTLKLKDGQRRTFPKSAVRKVLTRRPIWKRYKGWVTLGVAFALGVAGGSEDLGDSRTGPLSPIALFTGIAFLVASKMGGIYKVPPKYRMQPQKDKKSGAKSKAAGNTSP